jgi:hypothetical protein
VSAVRQAPSRKAREGAHPQLSRAMLKNKLALYFPVKVAHPPQAEHLATENGRPGRYTNYSFRRRQDVPALQCADAIAWTCYQYALLALSQIRLSQIAEECWDDYFNHRAKDWLYAAAMTRAQLADWVKREQEQGQPDFERFRRWQETNPKLAPKRRKKRV